MKVQVYVYDLTRGMASALSPMLLGTRIEGVWHTGVVLDEREELFFGYGISRVRAGTTMFGQPHHVINIGSTEIPKEMVDDLLADLRPRYLPEHYNLLFHNCNTFSNELCQLLIGEGLPEYILNQAEVIFNTPFGESITPLVLQMEGITGRAAGTGLAPVAAAAAGGGGSVAQPSAAASIPQPAAPSPWPAAAAAEQAGAATSSTEGAAAAAAAAVTSAAANAGMEATAQVVQEAASAAGSSTAAEEHRTAAAAAGMAAAARAAQAAGDAVGSSSGTISSSGGGGVPQDGNSGSSRAVSNSGVGGGQGGSDSSGAVGKVTQGVESLHITADSRTREAAS